jgi:ribosomal protein L31E
MKIRFNLLPQQQKDHLYTQKILRMIVEQEIYVIIVFGVLTLSLFAIYFLLKSEAGLLQGVEQQLIDQNGYQEIIDIHSEFKKVKRTTSEVNKILDGHFNWSRVLIMLSENINEKIIVDEFSTVDNQVKMRATAQTREDVVVLKEKFRDVSWNEKKCFENIVVPESDLASPKNVVFTMTFDINIACLR